MTSLWATVALRIIRKNIHYNSIPCSYSRTSHTKLPTKKKSSTFRAPPVEEAKEIEGEENQNQEKIRNDKKVKIIMV